VNCVAWWALVIDVAKGAVAFEMETVRFGASYGYDGTCIFGCNGGRLLCLDPNTGSVVSYSATFETPVGGWYHALSVVVPTGMILL
jgi:hypothetical protein